MTYRVKDWLEPLYAWGVHGDDSVDLSYGSHEDVLTNVSKEEAKNITALVNNLVEAVWFFYDRSPKELQDEFKVKFCAESPLKKR